jgi:hypothetical protein
MDEAKTSITVCHFVDLPKNGREVVRVALIEFRGRNCLDIRNWYYDTDGELRPGKGGLMLDIRHATGIAEGLAGIIAKARELGWLEPVAAEAEPASDPTAAERMRRYRNRKRNGGVTRNGSLLI